MGAIADVLSRVTPDHAPPGADAETYRRAVAALAAAGLSGRPRPAQPGNTTLLKSYGSALFLGPRATRFADQIGAVHDAVLSGREDAIGAAIVALYRAAGRPAPKEKALSGLVEAARKSGGSEPAPTVNRTISGEGYQIDIADAVAAGKTSIDVTLREGPGGRPARVLFEGTAKTGAKAGGDGLDRRVNPADPCVISEIDAVKLRDQLNGTFTDEAGRAWTLDGASEKVLLTETNVNGRKLSYEGTYRLGKIDARHAITHPDDIDPALPLDIRVQVARMGLFFTLRLETCRDRAMLTGRWGSQHVTYRSGDHAVLGVKDPYDKVVKLTRGRKDFRIVRLDIDYSPWEAKQSDLQSRLRLAKGDVERARTELTRTTDYEVRRQRASDALRAQTIARAELVAAEQRLTDYVPGDADKTPAYRKLEAQRDHLAKRVQVLDDGIMALRGTRSVIPGAAFENHERLSAELDRTQAALESLGRELGFEDQRARLTRAASDAFLKQVRTETDFAVAVASQERARARKEEVEDRVTRALAKQGEIEAELDRFSATAPRIAGVTGQEGTRPIYETIIWAPEELLAFLEGEITQLGAVLEKVSAIRRETREAFLQANAVAISAGQRLADGIWKSALAQGATEIAFNVVDVMEKTLEAGPIGALGEGAKKVVEAVVLGSPSFYEPSVAPQIMTGDGGPFSSIRANVAGALEYSAKRGFKSVISGPAAGLVVKKYIETKSMRVYLEAIGEAVVGSMATGYRIAGPTQGGRAVAAFEMMEKARTGFQKALKEGLFRNFGKVTGMGLKAALKHVAKQPQLGKVAHSVARDLAKMATKKTLSEWLEGVPLAEYLAAEAEARIVTQIFLATSAVYWESRDPFDARVADRQEVLSQYDPKSHMRIARNESFGEGAELRIELMGGDRQPLASSGHKMILEIGGKPATQEGGAGSIYTIKASDLVHDGRGGVVLKVTVQE